MSRIGLKPIPIPAGVQISVAGDGIREVRVQGPRGKLSRRFPWPSIAIETGKDAVVVKRLGDERADRALHGLARNELRNMIEGVVKGYERKLEVSGVGFKMIQQGKRLSLTLGFSHPVVVDIPEGIEIAIDKQTALTIRGADKGAVGQFAADIRRHRPPEPYQGKGIKYQDETIRRKEGKKSK
ncbi:MAG: 50S ribosomal protein L6 [Nitrospirota bacterium]